MNRISVQVATHIFPEERDKLDEIAREYNFKSRYELIQTVVRTFLKVADPEDDEVVCNDFIVMFDTVIRKTSI